MHIRKNMIDANEGFKCANCKRTVGPHEGGSCRNHCPYCLFSLHVDKDVPGDRLSECQGLMAPTGAELNKKKGPRLFHVCKSCGQKVVNRCAPDDDWELVCRISRIPQ
jgi:hypothetical protein